MTWTSLTVVLSFKQDLLCWFKPWSKVQYSTIYKMDKQQGTAV